MEEQLTELLKRINETSPLVWEAAIRQTQVDLIFNWGFLVLLLGLIAGGVWALRYLVAVWGSPTMQPKDVLAITLTVFALFAFIFLVPTAQWLLTLTLNPEWAAIDLILNKMPR